MTFFESREIDILLFIYEYDISQYLQGIQEFGLEKRYWLKYEVPETKCMLCTLYHVKRSIIS